MNVTGNKYALIVHVPEYCLSEMEWLCGVIFGEFLNVKFTLKPSAKAGFHLESGEYILSMPDIFISGARSSNYAVMEEISYGTWNVNSIFEGISLCGDSLPVLFGTPGVSVEETGLSLRVDIFGTCFFMLSRYEEYASSLRDEHGRFLGEYSYAFKCGFLDRPLVDEYVEVLFHFMERAWPGMVRFPSGGAVKVSCDVDHPFDGAASGLVRLFSGVAADVIKRGFIVQPVKRILNGFFSQFGIYRFDPFDTFDWYMKTCEKAGKKVTFYFISANTAGDLDGFYCINDSRIVKLMKDIVSRGHEIGVHGSYNSYNDSAQISTEKDILQALLRKSELDISIKEGRQHYLRWDVSFTPDVLNSAGLEYDGSGSFADISGFRFGTSKTFTMWSWAARSALSLKQRPLILMESSVISSKYMGLGYSQEAYDLMSVLKERSLWRGDFSILWHNSHLSRKKDRDLFELLVQ